VHATALEVRALRQAAERTGESVGDGTTTSTLLAQAIYTEGVRNVVAGASALDLKWGLERGMAVAVPRSRRDHVRSRAGVRRCRSRRFPHTMI
jgi:chaperonin GroEL